MTTYIKEEVNLLVSSNSNLGVHNKSPDGSRFTVRFSGDNLEIPSNARNCNVRVEEASIWYTTPNVRQNVNDKFYITGPDTNDIVQNFVITIPEGLYTVSNLIDSIEIGLQDAGVKYIDNGNKKPLIDFSPDPSTGKVLIIYNYQSVQIDFRPDDTLRDILGWGNKLILPPTTIPGVKISPFQAKFNQLDYYLIGSSLVNQGLRINDKYSHNLARILINVEPGSQIIYSPNHPTRINADYLIGSSRTEIDFFLTDQNANPVDTFDENWSANICIEYMIPVN